MSVTPRFLRSLEAVVGPRRCLHAPEDLRCYSYDHYGRGFPEAVVLPESTAEVSRILALCHAENVPVTPRGAATSLTGGPVPVRGGVALCTARMNRILEISPADRLARVQAGVITGEFKREAARQHLYYPPDPASQDFCTLGGNAATNAGGMSGVKYGVTRDYLLGMTTVLADGRVLTTGSRCLKRATGYDFTHFLCGSEGQLGVITELTLRLIPPPQSTATLTAAFADLEQAGRAVSSILKAGVLPSTLELMDGGFLAAVREVFDFTCPEDADALLLMEVDGDAAATADQAETVAALCRRAGCTELVRAETEEERARLWAARRGGSAALVRSADYLLTLDYSVPVSRIPEAIRIVRREAARESLTVVIIGHAGDGNLHPMFLFDPADPAQSAAFARVDRALAREMLALGGTLTGEHGIGLEKAELLPAELGETELSLSRQMKRLFDPRGIMNPGKCEWFGCGEGGK